MARALITGITGQDGSYDAIRNTDPSIRSCQASIGEIFGRVHETPQTETTPLHPRSPYGVLQAYAHWITGNYCEGHGLHASSGTLVNHEIPRRSTEFVTRKFTSTVARIKRGEQLRPAEGDYLVGDSSKAERVLRWKPKVGFDALVTMKVDADLDRLDRIRRERG